MGQIRNLADCNNPKVMPGQVAYQSDPLFIEQVTYPAV